ncbi:MAG: ClpXP protease specificity-enhancing factor [Cytophagales bacterium]|nr:ClpXP protease specificity-enhancing factor [Cytophagales bacterium]
MIVAPPELASAKPYLLRAMYEWCGEQGLTPYASVKVDERVQVPMEFVKDGLITLNIGMDATKGLLINNETLEFQARFGGIPRQVVVPITHVMAIYGRENGQGMAFPISTLAPAPAPAATQPQAQSQAEPRVQKDATKKPTLMRIK